jgi:phosphatidylglycerophosphate synthase
MIRLHQTITGGVEQRILHAICRTLPSWVTSDGLTALGVLGAALSFAGFALSNWFPGWLALAVAGMVLNWLGDSLDGTLARYRQTERPKYGFFIDHMTDSMVMALIAVGMGLSPYADLECCLAVLAAYFLMTILSLTTCVVSGVFQISFNGVGPTEIRLMIIACTVTAGLLPTPRLGGPASAYSIYDGIILVTTAILFLTCLTQAKKTLKGLAELDPPKGHHPPLSN